MPFQLHNYHYRVVFIKLSLCFVGAGILIISIHQIMTIHFVAFHCQPFESLQLLLAVLEESCRLQPSVMILECALGSLFGGINQIWMKMNVVGRLGNYISKGMNSVSAPPFHPFGFGFGGAVDIVVVEQPDGSFKSSPWYIKFGKFQGVLKSKETFITISVNGVEVGFHMHLNHAGRAYFQREVNDENTKKSSNFGIERNAAEIAAELLDLQWWTNLTHKDGTDHHELEVQSSSASDGRDGSADENVHKEHEFDSESSLEKELLFSSDIDESKNSERSSSSSSSSCEDDSSDNENNQPNECKAADYSNLLPPDSKATVRKMVNVLTPTSKEVASLSLKEGSNTITFTFCTSMLGNQQIDARIYLWKWNSRIVVSDIDGTITRSDVLGLCMPLVGLDWSQAGVTRLYSAIKENGYHLLFLSARSISQARLTRQFLFNLNQEGTALPDGPVVISPDGLFPSLYREVIKRVPHEFKISCLEDIGALFPPDGNSFHAGFGNRETDKISYLKVGIPKGNIFIINPKGEILVDRHVQRESYTSLHTLMNDMFPPVTTSPPR